MPPGAKKRKALKKKQQQQQEAIETSRNNKGSTGDNLHGTDEHGSLSQEDNRESDSTLSSPGSQGNDEFGATKDPSTAKEIPDATQGLGSKSGNALAAERGTDDKNNLLQKSPISSNGNSTNKITPVVDSVSQVVISETSTHLDLVKHKSDEKKEYQSVGKDNGKVATLLGSAAGTSKVECVRESESPVSSEEKRLLLPAPHALPTSWLSCCGLFDAMTGSDR